MALPWPQNHFGVFVVGKPKEHYHVVLFFCGGGKANPAESTHLICPACLSREARPMHRPQLFPDFPDAKRDA